MPHKWQCINVECSYKEYGNKGDKCPECGKSLHKVDNADSKMIFEIKDRHKAGSNANRKHKYHPIIAIIIGYLLSSILFIFESFLPHNYYTPRILTIIATILAGFIATFLSQPNKATIGLYEGLFESIISFITLNLILQIPLTLGTALYLILIFPLSGLIGGFIAKKLRNHT